MTVTEYVAEQTERMAEALAHFIQSTCPDRLDWQPSGENNAETRSALEQVSECIQVNRMMAALLTGTTFTKPAGRWLEMEFDDAEMGIPAACVWRQGRSAVGGTAGRLLGRRRPRDARPLHRAIGDVAERRWRQIATDDRTRAEIGQEAVGRHCRADHDIDGGGSGEAVRRE
jgi:hypothetical protein